jgi:acyltransferase family
MILFAIIISLLFLMGLKTPASGVFSKDIVTVLKPFLASGIVLHHLQPHSAWLSEFYRWGPLIVGIFFFISGYGLTLSLKARRGYVSHFFRDKIVVKLLVPFLLAFCLELCLNSSWKSYDIVDRLTYSYGPNLFPNDWFIYTLAYCYLSFLIAARMKSETGRLVIIILATLLFVVTTASLGYARNWWITPMAFSAGALYSHFEEKIVHLTDGQKNYIRSTVCLLVFFLFLISLSAILKNQVSTLLTYSLMPLLVVNIMTRLDVGRLAKNRFILFFGGISFEIYLLHGILIDYLRGNLSLSGISLIAMTIISTVGTAYAFKHLSVICQKTLSNLMSKRIVPWKSY